MQEEAGTDTDGKVALEGALVPVYALVTARSSETAASVRLSATEEADLMFALDEADRVAGTAADQILARLRRFG